MIAGNSQLEPIGESFARGLRRHGLSAAVEAAFICTKANELAQGRFEATRWQRGRLTLVAHNPLIAHELTFVEHELTAALRQKLGWSEERPLRLLIRVRP